MTYDTVFHALRHVYDIGGYGINLSEIDNLTNQTDSLSKKLLEHGVTGFCPTIISIKDGYEQVSV